VSKTGLGDGLFASQRYIFERELNPDFVLNQEIYSGATILLSGKNFGCGSSREHAVWALKDYGVRAIIAESFGEIFYNNCVRNGILCISLNKDIITNFGDIVTLNLPEQTADYISFEIAIGDKRMLLEGLDGIALTLEHEADIKDYFRRDKAERPWAY